MRRSGSITPFHLAQSGDPFVTHRFFVTIPRAVRLDVDVHFHTNTGLSSITVHDQVAYKGGFVFTGEDFAADQRAETHPVNAMTYGEAPVTLVDEAPGDPENRIYGAIAPSWFGTSVVQFGTTLILSHNTAGYSDFGIERADGSRVFAGSFAVGGTNTARVLGWSQPGDYTFFNSIHAGVGPQDLFAVGFVGPIGS